jgi:hypothetical protein
MKPRLPRMSTSRTVRKFKYFLTPLEQGKKEFYPDLVNRIEKTLKLFE